MTALRVDDDAAAELVAAGDWYQANARRGVATRFREAIEHAFSELSEAPDTFQVVDEWHDVTVRRVLVRGFPYQVVYGQMANGLMVFAIAHLHRSPGYWRARLTSR